MKRNAALCVVLLLSSGCFLITSGLNSGDISDASTPQDSASPDAPRPDGRAAPEEAGMTATDARASDGSPDDAATDTSQAVDGATLIDAAPDAGVARRLVWVTSMPVFGDVGLAAADAICTNEGGKAAFAYLQSMFGTAASRIPVAPTIEYRLPSGLLAFPAGSAIGVGPLVPLNEVLLPVAGVQVSSLVWTGTNKDTCQTWTTRMGLGGIGTTNSATQWDTTGGTSPCGASLRFYCFQR